MAFMITYTHFEYWSKLWSVPSLKSRVMVCFFCALITILSWMVFCSPKPQSKNAVDQFSGNFSTVQLTQKGPQRILIISFYRSGTSWLGELLSRTPNSFYVYEPLHLTSKESQDYNDLLNSYKGQRLQELLHCGISPSFIHHLETWPALFNNSNCFNQSCTSKELTKKCMEADFVFIKTVRLSLHEAEDLLMKPSLNLKVIYLTRDPRGVANSLYHMEKAMKNSVDLACPKMREDIQSYKILKQTFPRIMLLRYEDLALNLFEKISELWRFINDGETSEKIPPKWDKFLQDSLKFKKHSKIGSYKIWTKSIHEWQAWRKTIHPRLFRQIEETCDDVLIDLGYRFLKTISSVKDFSISSLLHVNCTTIPCNR